MMMTGNMMLIVHFKSVHGIQNGTLDSGHRDLKIYEEAVIKEKRQHQVNTVYKFRTSLIKYINML